ncbi:MAG: AAA-like domain-containing protein [Ardenticatenaceae bacterium]|nr:AAA-like domain-containing protein [Anaerolineales bacterium]MCB8940301.1 AAA-like domain-containing protein [Ardenticatenaceae bacterium]MCB8973316.1 AAA-like domain-containing protein [Ardenticatenaceae bacterium]
MANTTSLHQSIIFRAGGTLAADSPSYVVRNADRNLYEFVLAGHFCYALTTRQMGKSSLMIRTADRLEQVGIGTAIIDLSALGTEATVDQWYLGLLTYLQKQFKLQVDVEQWWTEYGAIPPAQRFVEFLRDVVLKEQEGQVVIFIDEIDTTLRLEFSDDFFAAIRSVYNARALEPVYERLVFVLLGVATPTDLMKDRRRTPFNIGKHIDLNEFLLEDLNKEPTLHRYEEALELLYPGQGEFILQRIFHWANGHPYLTQRLCLLVAERKPYKRDRWIESEIDGIVDRQFLSAREDDPNINFVVNKITKHPQKEDLLKLYRRIFNGEKVQDNKRSYLHTQLKLTGLVIPDGEGNLIVGNLIYHTIFNLNWITVNLPKDFPRYMRYIIPAAIVALIALIIIAISLIRGNAPTEPTAIPIVVPSEATTAVPEPTDTQPSSTPEVIVITNTPLPTSPTQTPEPTSTATAASTQTATATNTDTPVPSNLALVNGLADVFLAPSENFPVLDTLSAGENVFVMGRATTRGWLLVEVDGVQGFAVGQFFDLLMDEASLPLAPTPNQALVLVSASLFSRPSAQSIQLTFAQSGELLTVVGRDSNSNWLVVENVDGVRGFTLIVSQSLGQLLDWPASPAELEALSVFTEFPTPTPSGG